ncbi:MAG: hypothetical protein O9327_10690, partial [Polaromonas sp.]|nr:hypothetical protein [Polaromonas sp.]
GAQAPISQSTRVSASVAAPGLAAAATGARTRLFGGLGLQMPDDSGGMWGDSEPSDQILNCERTFDSMPKAAAPTRSFQPN